MPTRAIDMGTFAEFLGQPTPVATKKRSIKGTSFASFLQSRFPTPIATATIPKPVSTSPFNPLTPGHEEFNKQLDMRAGTQSLFKNFLSSLGGAAKEVGSLTAGKKSLPAMIAQPIIHPSQYEQTIERSLPKSPLNVLAKPVIRLLTPIVEGLGENFADILFSREEAANLNKASIQTVGKQAQPVIQTASVKNLTAQEKLNVVLNSANVSLAIAGVVTDVLKATGNKLATTNSFVKITPAQIRSVLKSEKPIPPQARVILENLAKNNQGFEMKLQRPSGGVKQAVGEAIGGKPVRSTEIKPTGKPLTKLEGGVPSWMSNEPFAHELVPVENRPFAHETLNKAFANEIAQISPKTAPETAIPVKEGYFKGGIKGDIDQFKTYVIFKNNEMQGHFVGDENAVREFVKAQDRSQGLWQFEKMAKGIAPETTITPKVGESTEGNKTSGIAKSINAKAIEQGMTDKGFEDLAEFNGTTFKEQAELVSKLDPGQAKAIVRGEQPLPTNIRSAALISAMEDLAKQTGDVGLMQDLANSPLATKISESASEVSLARMREKDSATMKLQEIKKLREAKAEKRVTKETRKVAKSLKSEVEKTNIPKEDLAWDKFLEEIQC